MGAGRRGAVKVYAVKFYKKALDIDDHLSDVHYNLGNALYLNEVIEEAIKHYKAAISLNPKKPESFYNLGNALCVKSDYENAVAAYEQAIEEQIESVTLET